MNAPNRWLKRTRRRWLGLVVAFSVFFILYQLISYSILNQYHSNDAKDHVLERVIEERVQHLKFEQNKKLLSDKKEKVAENVIFKPKLELEHKSFDSGRKWNGSYVGINPKLRSLYFQDYKTKRLFTCLSSRKKISWDKVNDDFCDCPEDGSDEPSTSACSNGKFYCSKSAKGSPVFIPSSRVSDGICDCCDGSDELPNPKINKLNCRIYC